MSHKRKHEHISKSSRNRFSDGLLSAEKQRDVKAVTENVAALVVQAEIDCASKGQSACETDENCIWETGAESMMSYWRAFRGGRCRGKTIASLSVESFPPTKESDHTKLRLRHLKLRALKTPNDSEQRERNFLATYFHIFSSSEKYLSKFYESKKLIEERIVKVQLLLAGDPTNEIFRKEVVKLFRQKGELEAEAANWLNSTSIAGVAIVLGVLTIGSAVVMAKNVATGGGGIPGSEILAKFRDIDLADWNTHMITSMEKLILDWKGTKTEAALSLYQKHVIGAFKSIWSITGLEWPK
jgi:hypothetical protein